MEKEKMILVAVHAVVSLAIAATMLISAPFIL